MELKFEAVKKLVAYPIQIHSILLNTQCLALSREARLVRYQGAWFHWKVGQYLACGDVEVKTFRFSAIYIVES